jgi:geranylgeranyl diphosphate synthase type 3
MENILLEPVNYYKKQKSKNIRKLLTNFFGKLLGVTNENIEVINIIIDDIHNASLVIDDIEDNSTLRRNEPCAHLKYGLSHSINGGYYSLFKSLNQIIQYFSQQTSNVMIKYMYYIHEGQGMDIYYTQNKIIPSLDEYEKMMIYKTGYAFICILNLLIDKSTNIIAKKNYENIKKTLILFSLFYQIRDDYINLTDPEYWKNKGFCQDFDEEKISYIITYFYTINEKDTINIIKMMKDKTNEGKIKILLIFHEAGLFDIIYEKLLKLKNEISEIMNLELIIDQLPFDKFNINNLNNI